jgi:hypothetical protein
MFYFFYKDSFSINVKACRQGQKYFFFFVSTQLLHQSIGQEILKVYCLFGSVLQPAQFPA